MPPLLVPPARPPVRAVVVVEVPFRCLAPAPAPPARGDEVVRGEPAPTLVALAAGPVNKPLMNKTIIWNQYHRYRKVHTGTGTSMKPVSPSDSLNLSQNSAPLGQINCGQGRTLLFLI